MKCYITNPYWKRVRRLIIISYMIFPLILLMGAVISILFSPRCPHKAILDWHEKDIIYEIDLKMFKDSNEDGIGDIIGFIFFTIK